MRWKGIPLGSVATLQRGFDLPTNLREQGPYPVISSGGLTGYHSQAKVPGPGVVTGRYGSVGAVYYIEEDFWPLNTTLWVKDFHGNEPRFVYELLTTLDFGKFSDKTGVPGVNRNDLHNILVICPPLAVQKRITVCLRAWDLAIERMERLIQLRRRQKNGLVYIASSLSKRELNLARFLTPKLRPTSKPNEAYWALGIRSHGKGTFQRYVENPQAIDMEQLYMVKRDDLIINITFAWEGAIAIVESDDERCLVSHRFPTYEFDRSIAIPEFVKYIVNRKEFFAKLSLISPGGAGRNRVLNKKDFLNLKVRLPEIGEQARFARLLSALDKVIEFESLRLQNLKHQKRGLMQKLLTGEWRVKQDEPEVNP